MRYPFAVVGLLVAAACCGTPAQAQNYPWCEYLSSSDDGGGRNCGFISFEQCMESARGSGSDCRINTLYTPPPGDHNNPDAAAASKPHLHHAAPKSQKNS
jgi:Protein of unknown function (DUF3551)